MTIPKILFHGLKNMVI